MFTVLFFMLCSILILLGFFFVPCTTFITIACMFSVVFGIFSVFTYLKFRLFVFIFCLLILVIIVFMICMFRSKIFNKIALNSKIDSTVIDENILNICEGDEGISVSRLNPVGKVEVNNMILEGKSLGRFIDEDTKVIVIKVTSTQLIVKIK